MSWYPIHLEIDDNSTFIVTAPDFPEVTTFGENLPQAMRNGRAAIEEAISARIADSEEIPPAPSETSGKGHFVELPMLVVLKTSLYSECRRAGVTRADLMRRLGWHREQVDRLFRLDHKSQISQLETAFRAIGLRVQVTFGQEAVEAEAAA